MGATPDKLSLNQDDVAREAHPLCNQENLILGDVRADNNVQHRLRQNVSLLNTNWVVGTSTYVRTFILNGTLYLAKLVHFVQRIDGIGYIGSSRYIHI